MEWFALIIPTVFIAASFIGWQLARFVAFGWWSDLGQHECGHIQVYARDGTVCSRCGGKTGWKRIVARVKFPIGWEIKS